jgi:hypothetical protein
LPLRRFPVGFAASFRATGKTVGLPVDTKISGVVLDNSNNPIQGVTLHVEGTSLTVQSDEQGQFVLQPAPVGKVSLVADGSTVPPRDGLPWPKLVYDLVTIAGQNNTIGMPIYLLPIDPARGLRVDETNGGTLTLDELPGFALDIVPGSATFPDGSKRGTVSVTLVHADKVPMVPNFGQQPRFIITIQPPGTHFNPPTALTMPNVDGFAPGQKTEMYSFDHDLGSFVSIGSATVSEDGTVIKSDPGVGVVKGGWHCGGNPQTRGTVADCPPCNWCQAAAPGPGGPDQCVFDPAQGGHTCNSVVNSPLNNCIVPDTGICAQDPNSYRGICAGGTRRQNGDQCDTGVSSSAVCLNGRCVGTGAQCASNCDDGNPLTLDRCVNGECNHPADGEIGICTGIPDTANQSCGACQTGATCTGGACLGGTPVPDGTPCGENTRSAECWVSSLDSAWIPSCSGGKCFGGMPLSGTPCRNSGACSNGVCQPPPAISFVDVTSNADVSKSGDAVTVTYFQDFKLIFKGIPSGGSFGQTTASQDNRVRAGRLQDAGVPFQQSTDLGDSVRLEAFYSPRSIGTASLSVNYGAASKVVAVTVKCDDSDRYQGTPSLVIKDETFLGQGGLNNSNYIKTALIAKGIYVDALGYMPGPNDPSREPDTPSVDQIAEKIYSYASINNLSPWVILATLQKEQSFVTGGGRCPNGSYATVDYEYRLAMGTNPSDPDVKGKCSTFSFNLTGQDLVQKRLAALESQLSLGAASWRRNFDLVNSGVRPDTGGANSVPWYTNQCHPLQVISNNKWVEAPLVKPQSKADAVLWIYTPDCSRSTGSLSCPGGKEFKDAWSTVGGPTLP